MSRRRSKRSQNSNQPTLRVRTEMTPDGQVEVDPVYNSRAIENLDRLYEKAGRDDYDPRWDDDHKVAFFLFQIFDEILSQYEAPPSEDIDPTPGVPHLREAPVRDVIDISQLSRATANLN